MSKGSCFKMITRAHNCFSCMKLAGCLMLMKIFDTKPAFFYEPYEKLKSKQYLVINIG